MTRHRIGFLNIPTNQSLSVFTGMTPLGNYFLFIKAIWKIPSLKVGIGRYKFFILTIEKIISFARIPTGHKKCQWNMTKQTLWSPFAGVPKGQNEQLGFGCSIAPLFFANSYTWLGGDWSDSREANAEPFGLCIWTVVKVKLGRLLRQAPEPGFQTSFKQNSCRAPSLLHDWSKPNTAGHFQLFFPLTMHSFQLWKWKDNLLDFVADVRSAGLQGNLSLTMANAAQSLRVCGLVWNICFSARNIEGSKIRTF